MATYNTGDESFSLIKETTPGVTPSSGSLLKIDHIPGTMPQYTSDFIESPVLAEKRSSGGNRKVNYRVEQGLKTHFCRDAATELLLTSAVSSGPWVEAGGVGEAGDTIKGGDVDTSFTIEKKVGAVSPLYTRYKGCYVTKFGLTVDASNIAEATFDILGMGRETATTASSLTYTPVAKSLKLTGPDMATVTIGGLSNVGYRALELNIETAREAMDKFGATSAFGIGSGARKVSGSVTFYREDFAPETALAGDEAVPITFTIGSGSDGYTFTIPAANCAIPQDEHDSTKYMVKVEFSAKFDSTAGTDIMITRL